MKKLFSKQNNQQYFRTDHLKNDLKNRSVRGGAITIATQAGKFILQMGSTVILARLLVPEDFGLIGMVTVVIGFASLFKDLGLATATIQKPQIDGEQVSTLFWINFAISCATAVVVAALSPVVAWFYGEPRLIWITLALTTSFIFGGLTVQHQALLRRQMSFVSLAKIEIISMAIASVSAVVSAWYGAGYWALIIMQLAIAATNAIGVWIACGWRPGLPAKSSGIRSMLAFGGNLTGFNIVNFFSRNLDNVLIGQYWGAQELGFYAQAYKLVLLPIAQINAPITSVALPALSSLQAEPQKYCKYYYKAILLISSLGMPMIGFLFASADKVILTLLGEQWLGVVPIFQFLMPAAFNATIGVAIGWVYQSLGRVDRQLRWGIVSSILNVILFAIGVRWGAIGVAAFYGLSRPLFLVAGFAYCYEGTPLKLTELAKTLFLPAFASIGAAIALIGINRLVLFNLFNLFNLDLFNLNIAIALAIDLILYILLYFAIWIVIPNGKRTLFEILTITKTLFKKT